MSGLVRISLIFKVGAAQAKSNEGKKRGFDFLYVYEMMGMGCEGSCVENIYLLMSFTSFASAIYLVTERE